MKYLMTLAGCLTLLMMVSCRSKSDKPGALESLGNLKNYAENIVKETKEASNRWEERKAKGDTVAIPYKDLQAFLPTISGYSSAEGPKGSQMNTPGMGSWSQAEQDYTNGEKTADVSIIDYNAAQQTFMGLTAMYGLGMSFEDDDKKQGPVDLGVKDVSAYLTAYKKEKRSELILIVADRFIVNLKSSGEDGETFLPSVAKDMKLGEMASK